MTVVAQQGSQDAFPAGGMGQMEHLLEEFVVVDLVVKPAIQRPPVASPIHQREILHHLDILIHLENGGGFHK
jgi:hypothetical protein